MISESFYSIQGEGQTMGIPAIFLRLAGCNLLCKSKSWICDSIEVWQKGFKTDFQEVLKPEWIKRLQEGAHLIFTGGEPMLHQRKIIPYIKWFIEEYGFKPIIEIETNGTKLIDEELFEMIDYINCSPKLSNSGEAFGRRFNELSLSQISKHKKAIFKLVIREEKDIEEILVDFGCIDMNKIVLMPAGENVDKLNKIRLFVVGKCLQMGWRFSDRLQVVIWNKATGV